jgi:hypothetical protein
MHTGTEGILPEGKSDYSQLLEDWRIYYEREERMRAGIRHWGNAGVTFVSGSRGRTDGSQLGHLPRFGNRRTAPG